MSVQIFIATSSQPGPRWRPDTENTEGEWRTHATPCPLMRGGRPQSGGRARTQCRRCAVARQANGVVELTGAGKPGGECDIAVAVFVVSISTRAICVLGAGQREEARRPRPATAAQLANGVTEAARPLTPSRSTVPSAISRIARAPRRHYAHSIPETQARRRGGHRLQAWNPPLERPQSAEPDIARERWPDGGQLGRAQQTPVVKTATTNQPSNSGRL